jgi:NAD-dependent SIR2 family protein deacetylase
MQKLGKLRCLILLNVDNLHLKSGIRPELIAELHNNITKVRCRRWEQTYDKNAGMTNCFCGGRLASRVVDFD